MCLERCMEIIRYSATRGLTGVVSWYRNWIPFDTNTPGVHLMHSYMFWVFSLHVCTTANAKQSLVACIVYSRSLQQILSTELLLVTTLIASVGTVDACCNGFQWLVVQSDYKTSCLEINTSHRRNGWCHLVCSSWRRGDWGKHPQGSFLTRGFCEQWQDPREQPQLFPARGGLDWISGKVSPLQRVVGYWAGSPGKWRSPQGCQR